MPRPKRRDPLFPELDLQPHERARLRLLLQTMADGKLRPAKELQRSVHCARRTLRRCFQILEDNGFPVEGDNVGRQYGFQLLNAQAARRVLARMALTQSLEALGPAIEYTGAEQLVALEELAS